MAGKKMKSFLDFFGLNYDYENDEDYIDEADDDFEYEAPASSKVSRIHVGNNDEEEEEEVARKPFRASKPKVVPMHSSKMMEVNIIKPKSSEDSQEICNTLLNNRPVVVNLEGFDPDEAQRIMDFICGCIFAIDGKYHQISKYIFIFSPHNVDISGDSLSFSGENIGSAPTINREF